MRVVNSPFSNAELCKKMGLVGIKGISEIAEVSPRIISAARNQGLMPKPKLSNPSGQKNLWDRAEIVVWLNSVDLDCIVDMDNLNPWRETENPILRHTQRFYQLLRIA